MKLVILDSYHNVSKGLSLDGLYSLVDEVTICENIKQDEIVSKIGDAQMVLLNKLVLTKEIISKCKNLKYIGLFATGFNNIDISFCKEQGIVVCNVPNYSTNSVSQHTFALILSFFNLVSQHNNNVKNGDWSNCGSFCFYDGKIDELTEKTIGIVGFGNIGKRVARIAQVFDMQVLVYNRTKYPEYENDRLKFVEFEYLLSNSDVVSLHCPLNNNTNLLMKAREFNMMKSNAIFINTARGQLVDELALSNALNNDIIFGAGLDVCSDEPIKKLSPLLTAKNCIITPHIAWACKKSRSNLIEIIYENISNFLLGHPKNNVAQ